MPKILFIGSHRPNRNGSQRFRMEQFFPYLKEAGFQCDYSWLINERDDHVLYSKGNWMAKFFLFTKAMRLRLDDIWKANNYDIIFIHREAIMTGTAFFERKFSSSKAKVIFDFDDAIWHEEVSGPNSALKWLKRPAKTATIIAKSDLVIAGNNFLAAYASQFNQHTIVIPTSVDMNVYVPSNKNLNRSNSICIGWSGSITTVKHVLLVLPVLKTLKEKYGERISFKLIGDQNFHAEGLSIDAVDWHFESEIEDLNKIDIGVMPLPDDEWSKGKCGFKAIQYMALQIPPVISAVGMNKEMVQHGVNGFLAADQASWIKSISDLIESEALRLEIGRSARKTITEKYSLQSQVPVMVRELKKLIAGG